MRKVLPELKVVIEGDKVVIVMGVDRLELGMADAHGLSVDLRNAVAILAAPR